MLSINKKSYILYYILISYNQKGSWKIKNCFTNRVCNLKQSFARLYVESNS